MMILGRRWSIPLAVVSAALILSFTRSVWLGAIAGCLVVVFLIPRRVFIRVVLPMAIVAGVASGLIYHRFAMSFDPKFAPDFSRLEMLSTGFRMIQDHPLFGIGPERMHTEFPSYYHGNDLANFYYGHLHNNIVQIAAERGLLCLAAFLWFIFALYADLLSMLKKAAEDAQWIVLSALAALTGFVVAGFFEYNFGDSEVLILLLFIVSAPYGAAVRVEISDESRTTHHSKVDVHSFPVSDP
jgi:O-antigen ligase